jgi:hypothetical protein
MHAWIGADRVASAMPNVTLYNLLRTQVAER